MEQAKLEEPCWTSCPECQGRGKKNRRLSGKARRRYQNALAQFEASQTNGGENAEGAPARPKGHLEDCANCQGRGLLSSPISPPADAENYPHVAIIGGGIGGMALAVACLHRGIPHTLYERDGSFQERSQGYGLTLQQASKAIAGLGILSLDDGIISTRHLVHTPEGTVVAEWGGRKWLESKADALPKLKRTNVHIARQSLRMALLEQLHGQDSIRWGHQLVDYQDVAGERVNLTFRVNGKMQNAKADLVVGADGIRSAVRSLLLGEETTPLRYLGCIVMLGICPLSQLEGLESPLLDSATVFQTANGNERIYMMPYDAESVMWQLSFPMSEEEAKVLSAQGAQALQEEALRRCPWHEPVPQILAATQVDLITGYPVYDRELLKPELLEKGDRVTLIGDAAHPMSPFKGQGANQALLDALALARGIAIGCRPRSQWREAGLRENVLNDFEKEMLTRSATKVKDSADAADFLHSEVVLHESNEPRGSCQKKDESLRANGKDE